MDPPFGKECWDNIPGTSALEEQVQTPAASATEETVVPIDLDAEANFELGVEDLPVEGMEQQFAEIDEQLRLAAIEEESYADLDDQEVILDSITSSNPPQKSRSILAQFFSSNLCCQDAESSSEEACCSDPTPQNVEGGVVYMVEPSAPYGTTLPPERDFDPLEALKNIQMYSPMPGVHVLVDGRDIPGPSWRPDAQITSLEQALPGIRSALQARLGFKKMGASGPKGGARPQATSNPKLGAIPKTTLGSKSRPQSESVSASHVHQVIPNVSLRAYRRTPEPAMGQNPTRGPVSNPGPSTSTGQQNIPNMNLRTLRNTTSCPRTATGPNPTPGPVSAPEPGAAPEPQIIPSPNLDPEPNSGPGPRTSSRRKRGHKNKK